MWGNIWMRMSLSLGRLLILITSTSFIHPDEHFQNTQIAFEDIFDPSYSPERTWEWQTHGHGHGPVRSIVPIRPTSHLALALLKLANTLGWLNLSVRSLVVAPRLVLFLLSLLVDRLVFRASQSSQLRFLHLSSLASLLFICRTFSNSLESICFTIVFILSLSILNDDRNINSKKAVLKIITWTILNLFLVFVRVSYVCFGLPIVLMVFYNRLCRSFYLFILTGFTALVGLVVFVSLDSLYFNRWPTIAPISLLLYNLDHQNLAQHGTHPYLLHLLVNGPIIFGPALWFNGWWQMWIVLKSKSIPTKLVKLSIATVVSGTLLLSLQPHQEPRFLLPLGFPLAVLNCPSRRSKPPSKSSKIFWVVHLLHSVITVILFGYLHQGGLQTALEALPPETETVISYRTFDVPSGMMVRSGAVSEVVNLRGAAEDVLVEALCALDTSDRGADRAPEAVLVAPRWALSPRLLRSHSLRARFSSSLPHLDLDRLPQIWNAGLPNAGISLYQFYPHHLHSAGICQPSSS